jgi:hypothetical protein
MKRSIVVAALVALTAAPALADANGDVRAAMLKFAGLKSYEMAVGSGARAMTMDIVRPDGMLMSSGGMQMVRIGTTMYMKMPGQSRWTKTSSTRGGSPGTQMADKIRTMATEANNFSARDLGMKNADGQSMHAYEVTQKDGPKSVVYIGPDGLIRRLDPKNGSQTDPIRFSKFNSVAPIRAPM